MDELISREAVKEMMKNHRVDFSTEKDYRTARTCANAVPPAEPKRGKWIKTARWGRVYYCNQCRNYLDFDGVNAGRGSTNFCPNCGADMREKGENSESN